MNTRHSYRARLISKGLFEKSGEPSRFDLNTFGSGNSEQKLLRFERVEDKKGSKMGTK